VRIFKIKIKNQSKSKYKKILDELEEEKVIQFIIRFLKVIVDCVIYKDFIKESLEIFIMK